MKPGLLDSYLAKKGNYVLTNLDEYTAFRESKREQISTGIDPLTRIVEEIQKEGLRGEAAVTRWKELTDLGRSEYFIRRSKAIKKKLIQKYSENPNLPIQTPPTPS